MSYEDVTALIQASLLKRPDEAFYEQACPFKVGDKVYFRPTFHIFARTRNDGIEVGEGLTVSELITRDSHVYIRWKENPDCIGLHWSSFSPT